MEKYMFFNDGIDDERVYQASDFSEYFKRIKDNGICRENGELTLRVTTDGNSMNSIVSVGSAYINGYLYINDSKLTLTHDTADAVLPRIDRVVLRLDMNADKRYIKAIIKKGVPNTNPVPPELIRNNTIYELSLAQVYISPDSTTIELSEITDERLKPSLCGVASSPPNNLDMQVIKLDDNDNPIEIDYLYNGKLYQKVKLSNPNANGYYETVTIDEYIEDGVTVGNTIKCTLTYSDTGTVTGKSWEVV